MGTIAEKFATQRASGEGKERIYVIRDEATDDTALALLLATAPLTLGNLSRDTKACSVEEMEVADAWIGRAPYIEPGGTEPEVGDSRFTFSIGGGTAKITNSLSTISKTAPVGGVAADFKGAIGVAGEGEDMQVQGVDIYTPSYGFKETHTLAAATVTNSYKGTLAELAGQVNDATFKGFAAGECLFVGADGTTRNDGDWDITYSFLANPNETNIPVGDITVPAKKGWEYLWARYKTELDAVNGLLVTVPRAAYVEKVYNLGDFSRLGIGTA